MADLKRKAGWAIAYLQEKAGAIKRPSGRYLRRQEIRMAQKLQARFKRQMLWVIEEMQKLAYFQSEEGVKHIVTKDVRNDITNFLEALPENEEIADSIVETSGAVYDKGAKDVNAKLKMAEAGVSFDLVNPKATEYLKNLKDLQLSNFRGSIKRETRSRIQKILVDGIEQGQSYSEMSRKIKAQGEAGVFSRARSELIAVNQVGRAYGTGNDDMIYEYIQETGAILQKFWQTVDDQQVTPECADNEAKGWIGMEEAFPSGDEFAPRSSNPRCRCVTSYRRVNLNGEPI